MKIRPVFIYIGILVIVILIMVFYSQNQNNISDEQLSSEVMPDDDLHKNLQSEGAPGRGNVSNEFKQKMEMLQKSVEENPNDTAAVKEYADLLASAHNPQKAIELYENILKLNPKRIDVLLGMTFAYYNLGNMEKADEYTQKVLLLDANNQEANYNLGAIEIGKGNPAKAKAIWENVIAKFPNTSVAQLAENSIRGLPN